ncbi:hypothetical protein TELCIR_12993 [Teladorsagia circumcincta]|uniref:Adenylosuccinate lyase C-terminal domain-containing protein n=1 Tax=Teladorsagia circumcincta TaxID=45464 RepID=A0A2G9U599_TELCI|nr:hypothetical protein TELCIR_12993 [Teladorsagia circumcincta]
MFKTILWRQLWIWLAEAEHELGLKQVTPEAIEQMKEQRDNIDWPKIREEERRLKHDVMAHNHAFGADVQLIFALAAIGAAVKKICTDIRVLQAMGELLEPFEKDQIGSSAMPYKKNPMKSERCCSLARKLIHSPQEALNILSDQGLERTLDDSANRRMLIPDSVLTTEAMLSTLQNIFEGLTVQTENVARIVREELPFLGLEKAMMWLTEEGVDRQKAHAVIRETALEAKKKQATQVVHMEDILKDPFFDSVRDRVMALVDEPIRFTGRCESQTMRFINEELRPAIGNHYDSGATCMQLDV